MSLQSFLRSQLGGWLILGAAFVGVTVGVSGCTGVVQKPARATERPTPAKAAISAEARLSFYALVDDYRATKRHGRLSSADCKRLAARFHAVYQRHGPAMAAAEFNRGAVLAECGDIAGAERVYLGLVDDETGYPPAYNNLGILYFERGQDAKAIEILSRGLALDQSDRPLQNNLGVARLQEYEAGENSKAFESSMRHFQNALALDTDNAEAYENLARLLYERGRRGDKSYRLLARLVADQGIMLLAKLGRESAALYNVRGLLLMLEHDRVEALKWFEKAVAAEPELAEAHLNIAMISLRFRGFVRARKSLAVAARDPSYKADPDVYLAMGVAHRGLGQLGKAEDAYKRAARLAARDPRPWFNLAVLSHEHHATRDGLKLDVVKRHYRAAKRRFSKFIALAAKSDGFSRELADARYRIGTIDEALQIFDDQEKLAREAAAMEKRQAAERERERQELLELERSAREAASEAN